ncbi:MAG: DUF4384 domain-containing protein [bacterium]|nr:DUF4384 domain-containing protein [bacterium]
MKTRFLLSSAFVIAILIGGCATPPPPSDGGGDIPDPFTMEVKVAKEVYVPGEFIVIEIWASEDCYLSLYDISTLGEVTQIFPNRYAADNLIKGGQIYPIPAKSDKFDFEVSGPAGIEKVRGVCTKAEVNFFEEQTRNSQEQFPSISDETASFERALDSELDNMPNAQWTEDSISFQVQ